jgi:hypothetical protein
LGERNHRMRITFVTICLLVLVCFGGVAFGQADALGQWAKEQAAEAKAETQPSETIGPANGGPNMLLRGIGIGSLVLVFAVLGEVFPISFLRRNFYPWKGLLAGYVVLVTLVGACFLISGYNNGILYFFLAAWIVLLISSYVIRRMTLKVIVVFLRGSSDQEWTVYLDDNPGYRISREEDGNWSIEIYIFTHSDWFPMGNGYPSWNEAANEVMGDIRAFNFRPAKIVRIPENTP